MPNLYLFAKGCGYAKTFFVRKERNSAGDKWSYWLGHRSEDGMSSHRVRVSRQFYDDFQQEIKRLEERWKAHKKVAADNFKKAQAISDKMLHCGGVACHTRPICPCPCEKCNIGARA